MGPVLRDRTRLFHRLGRDHHLGRTLRLEKVMRADVLQAVGSGRSRRIGGAEWDGGWRGMVDERWSCKRKHFIQIAMDEGCGDIFIVFGS